MAPPFKPAPPLTLPPAPPFQGFGAPPPPLQLSQVFPQAPYQPPRPDTSRPLFPAEQKRLDEYRAFLDESHKKVLEENPGLHPATADEMIKLKRVLLENFEGQLRLPDPQSRKMWLQYRTSEYNSKYFSALTPERQYAHQLLGDEMRGPGIFEGIVSNVYNPKDGGVQWGGVAGAGIGAVLGYMLSGTGIGSFLESWLGGFAAPLIMAVGGILGSWGGRVAEDYLMDYMKPKPTASEARTPAPAKGLGLSKELADGQTTSKVLEDGKIESKELKPDSALGERVLLVENKDPNNLGAVVLATEARVPQADGTQKTLYHDVEVAMPDGRYIKLGANVSFEQNPDTMATIIEEARKAPATAAGSPPPDIANFVTPLATPSVTGPSTGATPPSAPVR